MLRSLPVVGAVIVAAIAIDARRGLSAQVTVVRGEVVALECALSKGDAGRGEAHGAHAMTVARRGEPMAILADDGLYLVAGDYTANANAKLLDFVAKRVEAKGSIGEENGQKTIRIAAMMLLKTPRPTTGKSGPPP